MLSVPEVPVDGKWMVSTASKVNLKSISRSGSVGNSLLSINKDDGEFRPAYIVIDGEQAESRTSRRAVLMSVAAAYRENHVPLENMLESATFQGHDASSRKEPTAWLRCRSISNI